MQQGRQLDARIDYRAAWRRRGDVISYLSEAAPEVRGTVNGDPVPVPQDVLSKFGEWTGQHMYQKVLSVADDEFVFHGKTADIHWTCKRTALGAAARNP